MARVCFSFDDDDDRVGNYFQNIADEKTTPERRGLGESNIKAYGGRR